MDALILFRGVRKVVVFMSHEWEIRTLQRCSVGSVGNRPPFCVHETNSVSTSSLVSVTGAVLVLTRSKALFCIEGKTVRDPRRYGFLDSDQFAVVENSDAAGGSLFAIAIRPRVLFFFSPLVEHAGSQMTLSGRVRYAD